MKPPIYQNELSRQSPILLDTEYKKPKIEKMLAVLEDAGCIPGKSNKKTAVDVGCSAGLFASALSPYFYEVFGIDIDTHALEIAKQQHAKPNVRYVLGDSLNLPFPDNSIDLVLCNHVYEHVPDATQLFDEILRILSPNGVCYFGAASRLTFIEPHYHLPLLSWLPKPLAHFYMKVSGKGEYYYEKLKTLWGIRRLTKQFIISDYTLEIVRNPDRYKARDLFPKNGLLEKIPIVIWKSFYWVLPSYIFILRKRVA